ncbi:MAG: restriction endonuclease [Alphaproteobacteria bacterium]|nr:restriction endonuclease [Alphaproteobacteria bacterium]
MSVPDYQTLMLPVLELSASGELRIADAVDLLSDKFDLSDEDRQQRLPSGRQTTMSNRVHWAKTYLKQAGLVENTKRGFFKITKLGIGALAERPSRIDINYLLKFPAFRDFRERGSEVGGGDFLKDETITLQLPLTSELTPEDTIKAARDQINSQLALEFIDRLRSSKPAFFEQFVVQLLLAMGYGGTLAEAGRAIGRSGDNGVDGVIDQDTLGLDRVYVQAKRYAEDVTVGPAEIRDFFGSLDMHKATKGLFVTTSSFTKSAKETAERLGKRIVLIDGISFAQLMIRFNVGCRVEEVFEVKKIDEEFFE